MFARVLLLGLLGCHPIRFAAHRAEDRLADRGYTERTLVQGDLRLHYWKGGTGPPVVLIHGFGGNGVFTWEAQLPALEAEHTVLMPDLLWFGDSLADAPYTLDRQVDALFALLDAEGLSVTDLVGISYGGFVSMQALSRAPERFDRVAIVDSPGPVYTPEDYAGLLQRMGVADPAELFVPDSPEKAERLMDLVWYTDQPIPGFVMRDVMEEMLTPNPDARRALMADLRARQGHTPPLPTDRGARTRVIWGEQDEIFPLPLGHRLAAELGAEISVIPAAGHAPNAESPDAFNAALRLLWPDGSEPAGLGSAGDLR